jgi:hypothetical protein
MEFEILLGPTDGTVVPGAERMPLLRVTEEARSNIKEAMELCSTTRMKTSPR